MHRLTSTHSFVLPYSISDAGYVLGIKAQSDKFYKLPKDRLVQAQQAGMLPNPLPPYRLTFVDYLVGYLLWPALVLIAIVTPFMRRKSEPASFGAAHSA